jgi:hypothetical protein
MGSLTRDKVICEGVSIKPVTIIVEPLLYNFGYLVQCGILPEITKNIHRGNKCFIKVMIFYSVQILQYRAEGFCLVVSPAFVMILHFAVLV